MLEILALFSDIIEYYDSHEEERRRNGKIIEKVRIYFKDGSKLYVNETLKQLNNKYTYQWMRSDNSLIIRWDKEAYNHPDIETNPFHKHVETNNNIQPSEPMTLQKVLAYIAGLLGVF